jgi:hypothetical protein
MHRLRCPTVDDVISGAVTEAAQLTKLGRLTLYITFIMEYCYVTAWGYSGFAVRFQSCLCWRTASLFHVKYLGAMLSFS